MDGGGLLLLCGAAHLSLFALSSFVVLSFKEKTKGHEREKGEEKQHPHLSLCSLLSLNLKPKLTNDCIYKYKLYSLVGELRIYKTMEQLLGPSLLASPGASVSAVDALKGKDLVLLYFSASW